MFNTSHTAGGHRSSHVLLLLSLGTLLWASWQRCASTHRSRQQAKAQVLPDPLQTWEGEGGQPSTPASAA